MKSQLSRFVPPIVGDVLRSSAMYVKHRKVRHVVEKNRKLKDLHKGERCFILATGPSIKQQDLTQLKDELCISVSNFFVHEHYDMIRPAYHCIAPWHPPITLEQLGAWMIEVQEKTNDSKLVFGASDYNLHDEKKWFVGRDRFYLSLNKPIDSLTSYKNIDCAGQLPSIASVPVMAIFMALYFGCSPIYLLGTDHDWLMHLGESRHFYDESAHAMNKKGFSEWSVGSGLTTQFECHAMLWKQYELVRTASERQKSIILNATAGGLLDVFPRALFKSLF